MDMQEAKDTLVASVMTNAHALQKAVLLLADADPAIASGLKEILQASETYVFARMNRRH